MSRLPMKIRVALTLGLLFLTSGVVAAQEMTGLDRPGVAGGASLRPYTHVFIAYAIVIVVVLAWVVSIGRRLAAVERRLGD